MLMCFPGGNVALHKEWARASLIIASPSKPQRQSPARSRCLLRRWKMGGALCPALGERRAAAWVCAKGPKRHPDPKKTPARSGAAPRAAPEAAPQRPKRWTNLVCLIFASG